ncbi:MAG: D-TA family PLP-dependent enzyme [Planctomycetota bacterium]|nr:D-TA family PLP-dependent enzyme [Planctomycetota bacterium]
MVQPLFENIEANSLVGLETVASPALLVFDERIESNLQEMIRIAGSVDRLRPHCKTHKLAPIIEMEMDLGIRKHKCATLAEAEMLASCGVKEIFWAYPPVGPNIRRLQDLQERFPEVCIQVTADDSVLLKQLDEAAGERGRPIEVLLDLDPGLHRTGIAAGPEAEQLYQDLDRFPNLLAGGLHLYDGHNRHTDYGERLQAVKAGFDAAAEMADRLEQAGLPVPRIVAGGTGSFPCFAELEDPRLELSPGTTVFHDAGYTRAFPEMHFEPAAWLLTRVISRPSPTRMTLDLGHKACAADPPAGKRLHFPGLPDAAEVMQNEEHLVLEYEGADRFQIGDMLLCVPAHICPTTAVHQEVIVVRDGRVAERWPVNSRDRRITI